MAAQALSIRDYVSRFSKPFWAANVSELFERIAFYGMTPVLVPYLTQVRGFDAVGLMAAVGLWLHAKVKGS